MISTCPECGRSYPTHHGPICKLCVAKAKTKNEVPPVAVKSVEQPKENITEPVKQEVKPVIPPADSEADYFTPPPPVVESKEPKNLDLSIVSSSSNNMRSETNSNKGRMQGVADACPKCNTLNPNMDLFCIECGAMLFGSEINKSKEYPLNDIKGAFPDHINKLKKLGITNNMQLLDKAYNPTKRKTLALKTGISEALLTRLVNQADLLRLDGVEPNEAYLLETIGFNTMKILERKTAQDIITTIAKQKNLLFSKQIIIHPEEKKIKKWAEEVKTIEKIVI